MKLYNTPARAIQELKPIDPPKIGFYTCGPTVYDYLHVGNWSGYVRWDVLARTLNDSGYKVNWIMNITDVGHLVSDDDEGEDKLEKGARREGKTAWEVADFYADDFLAGLRALNISIPETNLVRATKHIPEQIELIKKLEDKGLAYIIDDGVYFDTSKVDDYGKLFSLDKDSLKAGARVSLNPQKRNPTDFALWKFSPNPLDSGSKRDMEWDSPWGKGFPGWHIECSAMAIKYLGETLDIHAGGIDHIQVHHTNEIAQSESVTGKPFARVWLHANFITIDGQKIAKSLQNGITLQDLKAKGYTAIDYRLFVLQSHYRTQANFTWDGLDAAHNRLKGLQAMTDLRFQPQDIDAAEVKKQASRLEETKSDIQKALNDDLNSPIALSVLSELTKELEAGAIDAQNQPTFMAFLQWLDEILGLRLTVSTDVTKEQKELIGKRDQARKNQDWTLSDSLRDQLLDQGIGIKDTAYGQVWHRTYKA